jgi:hypothetical protein
MHRVHQCCDVVVPRSYVQRKTAALLGLRFVSLAFILVTGGSSTEPRSSPLLAILHFYITRWAIGLFAYQSMDAIDGKQARRTGMAGPLGEMFDHGCGKCFGDSVCVRRGWAVRAVRWNSQRAMRL